MKIEIMKLGLPCKKSNTNTIIEEDEMQVALELLLRDHKDGPLLLGEDISDDRVYTDLDDSKTISNPIIEWSNLYIQNGTLYGEMTEESEEYIKNNYKEGEYFFSLREVGIPLPLSRREDSYYLEKDIVLLALDIVRSDKNEK